MAAIIKGTNTDDTKEQALAFFDARAYPPRVQQTLLDNFQTAMDDTTKFKLDNGWGASVKLVITNVSGQHFLIREDANITYGKSADDRHTIFPREVAPLKSMAGFHAQRILALKGSFGCVQYSVRDKLDNVKAYVAIAWGQPLLYGAFHCHVAVGRTKVDGADLVQTCEDGKKPERNEEAFPKTYQETVSLQQNEKAISEVCDASDAMKPGNNITISGDEKLTPFIAVRTGGLDGTTAELFVAVKGDRIAKVAEDPMNSLPIEG